MTDDLWMTPVVVGILVLVIGGVLLSYWCEGKEDRRQSKIEKQGWKYDKEIYR